MKIGLVAASLVLIAGGATACSNNASKKDFCAGYDDFVQALADADEKKNYGEQLKEAASDFEDVGTPEDIPDDAKEGLEIVMEAIQELDDDATLDDVSNLSEDLSEDENKKAEAFQEYLSKTCPDAGENLDDGGGGEGEE